MAAFFPRPDRIVPDWGNIILSQQSCWFTANDKSRAPKDLLNPGDAATAMQTNFNYGNTAWGRSFLGDGSATSYLDLGSANRFLSSDTQPCTISWVEHHTGAATNFGVCHLKPSGSANSFAVLRINQATITNTTYGHLSLLKFAGTTVACSSWLGPPLSTANVPLVFVLTCSQGIAGTGASPGSCSVYWGGSSNGFEKNTTQSTINVAAATQNYLGWDGADNKMTGGIDNLRVWNRVLNAQEINQILQDPYYGCYRPKNRWGWLRPSSAPSWFAPWTMMPCGFPP